MKTYEWRDNMYEKQGSKAHDVSVEIARMFARRNVSTAEGMVALCLLLGTTTKELGLSEDDAIERITRSMRTIYARRQQ